MPSTETRYFLKAVRKHGGPALARALQLEQRLRESVGPENLDWTVAEVAGDGPEAQDCVLFELRGIDRRELVLAAPDQAAADAFADRIARWRDDGASVTVEVATGVLHRSGPGPDSAPDGRGGVIRRVADALGMNL